MEKTYKNYKITRTIFKTLKRISTTDMLAESEDEVRTIIEKRNNDDRGYSMRNSNDCEERGSSDTLISLTEKIEIAEQA